MKIAPTKSALKTLIFNFFLFFFFLNIHRLGLKSIGNTKNLDLLQIRPNLALGFP